MMFCGKFLDHCDIVSAVVPVDFQTAANTGDYVKLTHWEGVAIVVFTSIGTAGDDPVITVNQATAAAGTGAKALTYTAIRHKTGATALSAVGQWTAVTQTASEDYDTVGIDGAENEQIVVIDIKATSLDADNDFDWVNVSIADVGTNAQLGCALYILYGSHYGRVQHASPIA